MYFNVIKNLTSYIQIRCVSSIVSELVLLTKRLNQTTVNLLIQ